MELGIFIVSNMYHFFVLKHFLHSKFSLAVFGICKQFVSTRVDDCHILCCGTLDINLAV